MNVKVVPKVGKKQVLTKQPYYTYLNPIVKRVVIKHPSLNPMAALHLAATKIQSCYKAHLQRKYKWYSAKIAEAHSNIRKSYSAEYPYMSVQKLRSRFMASSFNKKGTNEEEAFKNFCAARIQATFRMSLTRRLFKYHRFSMYHIAAMELQWAWRNFLHSHPKPNKEKIAGKIILRALRKNMGLTNRKIFDYYKEIINFRLKGDPSYLLRSINPKEAGLIDCASKLHVRFRLGGDKFPPLIYYKIFTHAPVCDVGAYAPRNYAKIKRALKKESIDIKKVNQMEIEDDLESQINKAGWYVRHENNGWRPISEKILKAYDIIEITTANKPKVFHYNPKIRKKLSAQQKRKLKLRWLRQMYNDAKQAEDMEGKGTGGSGAQMDKLMEDEDGNPFEDSKFEFMEQGEFEDEVNDLIEWCEGLDYDKYVHDWSTIATSAGSDKFANASQQNLHQKRYVCICLHNLTIPLDDRIFSNKYE